MKIGIFGCGGFGRELVGPVQKLLLQLPQSTELVFIDDTPQSAILPVISLAEMNTGDKFIIAVGDGQTRQRIEARCMDSGLQPFSFFACTNRNGNGNEIGPGAVFCDNTLITANAKIGRQFQANIYSYVAHDCVIGDYVTFAPRVNCSGNVHIDDYAYIGTGAILRQGTPDKPLRIGRNAIVGMGAVVTKDVPEGVTVVGNPAAPMR